MPDPPDENPFVRLVLENPWPLGIVLLAVGAVLGWWGLREGRLDRLRLAAVPLALGVVVLLVGSFVKTSGERARPVVRGLVDAVVAGDLVGAVGHFADDVRVHLGSTRNVPHDLDFVRAGLSQLIARYAIESNRISRLRAYSTGAGAATVHLACWTEVERGGISPSQWVLEVEEGEDGTWKISRLTLITVNGRPPPSSW